MTSLTYHLKVHVRDHQLHPSPYLEGRPGTGIGLFPIEVHFRLRVREAWPR